MAEKLFMLALSPTMDAGTIAKWIKKEGDTVKSGDLLCEVETDKATMEYESSAEGVILKILVNSGNQAKVGEPIAIVGKKGEDFSSLLNGATPVSKTGLPGTASSEKKTENISTEKTPASHSLPEASALLSELPLSARNAKTKSSPLARKIAAMNQVNIHSIAGTGPSGRVIKRDVEQALAFGIPASTSPATQKKPTVLPPLSENDEKIPLSGKRKVIAQRLTESKFSAPHFYLKLSVAMDKILETRTAWNEKSADTGRFGSAERTSLGKLSLNAFIIKFVAEALKKNPAVNAGWRGDHIVQFGSQNIGLAVAQTDGLITPIVRDAGKKGIRQIDQELKTLIEKAQNNKLTPEEYTGATFTISSLGSFGIEEFTAIINPPGSAILAIGEIKKTPVYDDEGALKPQQIMKLTLSCDHRVIDGTVGSYFLKELKETLENPIKVLL
jgi:pyruvate dehydrogenase E2 component (dihydrolipoamide acetyltransferase)